MAPYSLRAQQQLAGHLSTPFPKRQYGPRFSLHLLRSESRLLRGEPKVCLPIYAVPSSEDEGITEGTMSTAETKRPAWLMGLASTRASAGPRSLAVFFLLHPCPWRTWLALLLTKLV